MDLYSQECQDRIFVLEDKDARRIQGSIGQFSYLEELSRYFPVHVTSELESTSIHYFL